jgi:Zn-dependent peptidase ImmA (M78 family)
VRHGFKAQTERLSEQARKTLGLDRTERLDPWLYAKHVGVIVIEFSELDISKNHLEQLLRIDGESWSGMTIKERGVIGIVINPTHAHGRQSSTLMHELAHVLLKHVPTRVDISASGLLLLSEYSEDAEAEADWLAGALLLPRDTLFNCRRRGDSIAQIATAFGTSEQLCEWRVRMTGVDLQLSRLGLGRHSKARSRR